MSINVTKSSPVLVGPLTAPATPTIGHINLSSFDKALAFFPHHVVPRLRPRDQRTRHDHKERALSHAPSPLLPHRRPRRSGRRRRALHRLHRRGRGVRGRIGQLLPGGRHAGGLWPFGPLGAQLVQVTEFSCGGFVVGVTRNHVVADGKGMAHACRTRVVMADPETPAPLVFAANVRKHVGAKDGYYGNCITSQVVLPKSGEVANGDVHDVVKLKLVPHAKQQSAGGTSGTRRWTSAAGRRRE
ncbi:hypothetical protein EJB05_06752, partial [Eragrostis curvula]